MRGTSVVGLPPLWAAVALLQVRLAACFRSTPSQGESEDEAFSCIVDECGRGELSASRIERRFRNLTRNRAQKFRSRRRFLSCNSHLFAGSPSIDPREVAANRELSNLVRGEVSAADWCLLREIADGMSIDQLAAKHGASPSSIKSRVFRARDRIRESQAGRRVAHALSA